MRIVTLNVRNPSFPDGERAWPHRRDEFFGILRRLEPDVLCLQETITTHVAEILDELPWWAAYCTPREADGTGEMCAILWNVGSPALDLNTEWLGDRPDVPGSIAPGAKCPRVVSWIDFGEWAILNTHLDHVGREARTNGMAHAIRRADALRKPCLIVGDLNAPPDEPALELAREAGLVDLAEGTGPTFHGFGAGPLARIDYVLARGPWRCERAWVETGDYSDHWAVVVDVELATLGYTPTA